MFTGNIPAHHPSAFIAAATVVVLVLLVGTITGRYLLRRIALTLAVIAAAAVVVLDGASPL